MRGKKQILTTDEDAVRFMFEPIFFDPKEKCNLNERTIRRMMALINRVCDDRDFKKATFESLSIKKLCHEYRTSCFPVMCLYPIFEKGFAFRPTRDNIIMLRRNLDARYYKYKRKKSEAQILQQKDDNSIKESESEIVRRACLAIKDLHNRGYTIKIVDDKISIEKLFTIIIPTNK